MTTESLTEAERTYAQVDPAAYWRGRWYSEASVERILADRLAAVQAERDTMRERVERVEELALAYEAWDGSDPHSEFSSSPRQRAQLRAALDADR